MKLLETSDKAGAIHGGALLEVTTSKRPGFRWEAAPNRLRLVVNGKTRLWARSELNWWQPPFFAHDLNLPFPAVIPFIHADDLRVIRADHDSEEWWRAWTQWFVRALETSMHSPLYSGHWRLGRLQLGPIEKATAWGYLPWDNVPMAHSLGTVHGDWGVWCGSKERSAQGEVFMLRALNSEDVDRAKMWKKRALEDRLPPILVFYCAPLGIFTILDGHVRLQAALETGKTPALLALAPVHAREKRNTEEWRKASMEQAEIDAQRFAKLGQRGVDLLNAMLIDAFEERTIYVPKARAWPIAGGVLTWGRSLSAALRGHQDPIVRALRDDMLGAGKGSGRILNRERRSILD